ncbi:MAG: DUF2171 domain-containing protein [Parasphingopyxis sp.]|uniref:DUF2171 domain-containing protein n=1 Tax=Parasphingopyxis sp. TaxID=1920299 RepID=UPI003F9F21D5
MKNQTMQRNATRGPRTNERSPIADIPEDYDYDERGLFSRTADEIMSWFGDDEAEARRKFDTLMDRRFGTGSATRSFSARPWNRHLTAFRDHWSSVMSGATGLNTRDADDEQFSDDYVAWRNSQIAAYDRDYEEFMREKQERFNREFSQWRKKRYEQRLAVGTVKEGQEVTGSDGEKVGTVDYIRGSSVILAKNDPQANGHHHSIPSTWIDEVTDKVILNRTAEEAQEEWRDIEARKAFFESDYESDDPNITEKTYARTLHDKV